MSAIEVERDAGSAAARAAACRVVIDSLERGHVGHGERLCFDVPPGVHTVRIAVDGEDCPPVKVFVGLGTTVLRCLTKPRLGLGPLTLSAARTRIVVQEERVTLGDRGMLAAGAALQRPRATAEFAL